MSLEQSFEWNHQPSSDNSWTYSVIHLSAVQWSRGVKYDNKHQCRNYKSQKQEKGREQPSHCDRCYGCSGSVWLLKTHRLSHCLVWVRRPEPKHSRAGEHCVPFVWKVLPDYTATVFPARHAASFVSLRRNPSKTWVRFQDFSDRTRHFFSNQQVIRN